MFFTTLELCYHLLKKKAFLQLKKVVVAYEFSCRARYVGHTTQRLADRIKQNVPTSIRRKGKTVREQPPRLCKNNSSKINCGSAIGQHLLTNPECAKTYTDDNFRIIRQARSSFHLNVLESVYIKTQSPVLCKQKDFIVSIGIFKQTMVIGLIGHSWVQLDSSSHMYPHLAL